MAPIVVPGTPNEPFFGPVVRMFGFVSCPGAAAVTRSGRPTEAMPLAAL